MKLLAFVLFIFYSTIIVADKRPEWEVNFGWQSGWGHGPMYSINSTGKMKVATFNPHKEKGCVPRLEKDYLKQIKLRIDSIPKSLPVETSIQYLDWCSDEREIFIYITNSEQMQAFKYSSKNDCWRKKIPQWLQILYKELEQHESTIETCKIDAE